MTRKLDRIRAAVGDQNLARNCSRDGCRGYLSGVPSPRLIFDVDKALPSTSVRCDFILFLLLENEEKIIVAPIELKSGSVDVSETIKQLMEGASIAHRKAPDASCVPILIHGKSIHKSQRDKLIKARIKFGNKQLTIKTARCADKQNLKKALFA